MSEHPEEETNRAARSDDSVDRLVKERLTEERLELLWGKMQRTIDEHERNQPQSIHEILGCWRTVVIQSIVHSRFRWASGLAAFVLVLAALWWALPQQVHYYASADSKGVVSMTLPRNLRFSRFGGNVRLFERDDFLEGAIAKSNDTVAVISYFIDLSGRDNTGAQGRLRGMLWISNTVPRRVFVSGEFWAPGRPTNVVSQLYESTRH